MRGALLLLPLLWAAARAGTQLAADWCLLDHEERLGFLNRKLSVYNCPSTTPLLLLPFVWSPVKVFVQCPTTKNAVYTAPDMPGVLTASRNKEASWCGWEGLLDRHLCSLQLSPFSHTVLGVEADQACRVQSESTLDFLMVASVLAGLILFYAAPPLSTSVVFRLSCGSALFTAGSMLVLLIFLFRFIPHKRTVAAVTAATGSGSLAILRWLTGKWMPPLNQLLLSRAFGAYVLLSVAGGAAATYLYDDRKNPRVNTLIKASLRVAGLALVYFGTWTFWPFSACCLGVMVASITGPGVARGVHHTSQQAHHVLKSTSKLIATPFRGRTPRTFLRAQQQQQPPPTPSTIEATLPTPRVVDFDASVDPLTSPDSVHERITPLHLRTPPPPPWEVQPKRRVATFEETMVKSLLRKGGAASSRGRARGSPAAYGASQGAGSNVTPLADDEYDEFEGVQQQQASPLVKSGFLINPLSGRPIKIGGDTYNRLLEEGYRPDVGAGVMLLPERQPLIAEEEEEEEGSGLRHRSRGAGMSVGTGRRVGSRAPAAQAFSSSSQQQQTEQLCEGDEPSTGSRRPPRFQW